MKGLRPCPFCGSKVKIVIHSYGVMSVIDCEKCHARFIFPWSKTETTNDLCEVWNERVGEPEVSGNR